MLITTSLTGLHFRLKEAKAAVAALEIGSHLILIAEPENKFDSGAVQVLQPETEIHLGYIPRIDNIPIAAALASNTPYTCLVIDNDPKRPTLQIEF